MLAAVKGLALSRRLQDVLFIDMFPQKALNIREEKLKKELREIGAGMVPQVKSMEGIRDDKTTFI